MTTEEFMKAFSELVKERVDTGARDLSVSAFEIKRRTGAKDLVEVKRAGERCYQIGLVDKVLKGMGDSVCVYYKIAK